MFFVLSKCWFDTRMQVLDAGNTNHHLWRVEAGTFSFHQIPHSSFHAAHTHFFEQLTKQYMEKNVFSRTSYLHSRLLHAILTIFYISCYSQCFYFRYIMIFFSCALLCFWCARSSTMERKKCWTTKTSKKHSLYRAFKKRTDFPPKKKENIFNAVRNFFFFMPCEHLCSYHTVAINVGHIFASKSKDWNVIRSQFSHFFFSFARTHTYFQSNEQKK